jgi:hypothetical protein
MARATFSGGIVMNRLAALLISLLAMSVGTAFADPATHTFKIASAQTMSSDCGQGGCSVACKLTGVATNVSPRRLQSVSLEFHHPHPGLDPDTLAITAFTVPALQAGASETVVEWVNGLKCRAIRVGKVKVKCLEGFCSFISIRIPQTAVPKLNAMKIDVD